STACDSVNKSSPSCSISSIARIGEKYNTAQPPPRSTKVDRILIQRARRRLIFRCSGLGGSSKTVSSISLSSASNAGSDGLAGSSSTRGIPVSVTVFSSEWIGRSTEIDLAGFLAARPGNFSATWLVSSELFDGFLGGFFDMGTSYCVG